MCSKEFYKKGIYKAMFSMYAATQTYRINVYYYNQTIAPMCVYTVKLNILWTDIKRVN